MNTNCKDCYFSNTTDSGCSFNIPELIKYDFDVKKIDGYNKIQNYKCSYAFSKKSYSKHKDNLPIDMEEFARQQNILKYFLIIDCENQNETQIISIHNILSKLNNPPEKLSILGHLNKSALKNVLNLLQEIDSIDWKFHNLIIKKQDDTDKLFDILNVATIKQNFILYIHFDSIEMLQEDINYINFLYNVKKPKYAAIRKNDNDMDGLCISANNLSLIKKEHGSEYIKFLSQDTKIIKKYYE